MSSATTGTDFGVLTMAVTDDSIVRACALERSIRIHEPDIPVLLLTHRNAFVEPGFFDDIVHLPDPEPFTGSRRLLNKLVHPFNLSPFRRTLFLDDDTLVVRSFTGLLEDHFRGLPICQNAEVQQVSDQWRGNNRLAPSVIGEMLNKTHFYNVYGGGHYYFETGPLIQRTLHVALDLAINRRREFERLCGAERMIDADEIAFMYAANYLNLTLPVLPDFVDGLVLSDADKVRLDVERSRYDFPTRGWGEVASEVRIAHFCGTGKLSLAYSNEILKLTGMRQSFDIGMRGVKRRLGHRALRIGRAHLT